MKLPVVPRPKPPVIDIAEASRRMVEIAQAEAQGTFARGVRLPLPENNPYFAAYDAEWRRLEAARG